MNLYGASGHAKVILDIIRSKKEKIDFVLDDNQNISQVSGEKVVHMPTERIFKETFNVVAIGDNYTRKKIAATISGDFHPFIAHVAAVVSPAAKVGNGTVVMANAIINAEAVIGEHCIINTGSIVEHDVVLGDFVHISPNATIAGNVKIGEGTHVGIGALVIPGIEIGKWATIGAGAVILKDVPDNAVVVGNPGRIVKFNEEKES